MRRIVILFFLVLVTNVVDAQRHEAVITNTTSGRWEIVQSRLMRSMTFKLDKFTGDIYLLDEALTDTSTIWLRIPREISENDTIFSENAINYQLYLGGQSARDCFLINLNSGIVWFFTVNEDYKYAFDLLE